MMMNIYGHSPRLIMKVAMFVLLLAGSSISLFAAAANSTTNGSMHPLRREGFTCHSPDALRESVAVIKEAMHQEAQVRFRRINVRYPVFHALFKGILHHDWIQVAGADHPEDERPLACFDPRISDDDFNDKSLRLRNGCWIFQSRAQLLRDFMGDHLRLDAKQGSEEGQRQADQWFAEMAKVMSFLALKSTTLDEFKSNLRRKNFTMNALEWTREDRVVNKVQLLKGVDLYSEEFIQSLWEASVCILPMYSEMGVQANGIEDHLRYGRIDPFNVKAQHIVNTPYKVAPACARLAISDLIPLGLNGYDRSYWKSTVRVLANGNSYKGLGCLNPRAEVNCQIFPRCWQMSLEHTVSSSTYYPECEGAMVAEDASFLHKAASATMAALGLQ